MSNETTNNFWQAFNTWELETPKPVFYRLYYNDDGTPICYSMEDLPGKYIELTLEEYSLSPPNVRVVNGRLQVVTPASTVTKLHPSVDGTPCHPGDVCIVVDTAQPHTNWSTQINEIN
jgi:hypothetical protein